MGYPVSSFLRVMMKRFAHNCTGEHGHMEMLQMNGDEKSGIFRCVECGQKIAWRGTGKNMEFRNV